MVKWYIFLLTDARGMIHDTRRLMKAEQRRLDEAEQRVAHWKRWGPYLSQRQ